MNRLLGARIAAIGCENGRLELSGDLGGQLDTKKERVRSVPDPLM